MRCEPVQASDQTDGWTCSGCGCTNERACGGGCWWVAKNKCSGCFDQAGNRFARGDANGGGFGIEYCPASETPTPHAPVYIDDVTCYCARCRVELAA